jgi:peptidoglycan LD-endopeptidase LytH
VSLAVPASMTRVAVRVIALAVLGALAACKDVDEALRDAARPSSPHERYARSLRDAGLDRSALGGDWLTAADKALAAAAPVTLPFREAGYFAESEARAVAYQVAVRRGQRVVAAAEVQGVPAARLFIDVYEPAHDSARGATLLASADRGATRVAFEAERDGVYLIRVQPELLRSIHYVLTVQAEASLAFPVTGRDRRAVQSFFGAGRDAGRRAHQGIDIFAPRGTPVLAAAPGIANPGENRLGGHVVWVWDPTHARSLYYAHLDSQAVAPGQPVRTGDTLGFVGNTGNARTTPPHLHFGIYARGEGAIDPLPFVVSPSGTPPTLAADPAGLGTWRRVDARRGLALYAAPPAGAARGAGLRELPARTVVKVDGIAGRYYRVRLPDGSAGYVSASGTAAADTPVDRTRPAMRAVIRDQPSAVAAALDSVPRDTALAVLGRFGDYLYVRTPGGRTGWLGAN